MATEDGEEETPERDCSPAAVMAIGRRAGTSLRDIAANLHCPERVDARRDPDGWMRAKLHLLLCRSARQIGR